MTEAKTFFPFNLYVKDLYPNYSIGSWKELDGALAESRANTSLPK